MTPPKLLEVAAPSQAALTILNDVTSAPRARVLDQYLTKRLICLSFLSGEGVPLGLA